MVPVAVLEDPASAAIALDPVRARILAALREPASAAALAQRLGVPRQRLGHHLRVLEEHGLVREVETRRWGGLVERVLTASAERYVVSPAALGEDVCDPARHGDRLSARYLVAVAGRLLREVGALLEAADRAGLRLATLTIDTEIRFRSPAERAAFTEELAASVTDLVARYHSPEGRSHRLVVAAHPITKEEGK